MMEWFHFKILSNWPQISPQNHNPKIHLGRCESFDLQAAFILKFDIKFSACIYPVFDTLSKQVCSLIEF